MKLKCVKNVIDKQIDEFYKAYGSMQWLLACQLYGDDPYHREYRFDGEFDDLVGWKDAIAERVYNEITASKV